MNIIFDTSKFIAQTTYEERAIPKQAGFRWNPEKRYWWTDDFLRASALYDQCSETAKTEIDRRKNVTEVEIESSKAVDAEIEIPVNDGMNYLPFQRAGIAYSLNHKNVLIGDEMGLGKTIQAIGISNADESIKSILIICPASLRLNWQREWKKWDVKNLSCEIANSCYPKSDVVIINYDILKKHRSAIRERAYDLLIVDECHYLKNAKALRTHEVYGKFNKDDDKKISAIQSKRKVFLTGTPILNRPSELWTLVHAIEPGGIGKNWTGFVMRYCDAHQDKYGWDTSGSSNLAELQTKLRSSFMIRRLKKDVLTELPAKRRQVISIPANGCSGVVKKENQAYEAMQERIENLRIAVELAKCQDEESYKIAVSKLHDATSAAFSEISKLRHETAVAKIPFVIDYIKDTIENTDKLIVFAHHHDVINALMNEFKDIAVSLTGEHTLEQRQIAVDRFQNDPAIKIFIGSIHAAGVGITLTAASTVIFAELDWVPGNVTQAEDRCHRIGQTESVLVQHLVLDGSLDATMAQTIVSKQNIIDAALDDTIRLEISQIAVIPGMSITTESISRKNIDDESVNISDEEIVEIHSKLKIIAGMDEDYAQNLNGVGFSKFDARIGHSLAESNQLTKKQAALGRKLVNKYRRQIQEIRQ